MKFYLFDKYLGIVGHRIWTVKEMEDALKSNYFDNARRYFVPESQCHFFGLKAIDSTYPIPAINTLEIYNTLLEKGLITND